MTPDTLPVIAPEFVSSFLSRPPRASGPISRPARRTRRSALTRQMPGCSKTGAGGTGSGRCRRALRPLRASSSRKPENGRAASTLGRRLAAIRFAHKLAGEADPTDNKGVQSAMKGARRKVGVAPTQKARSYRGDPSGAPDADPRHPHGQAGSGIAGTRLRGCIPPERTGGVQCRGSARGSGRLAGYSPPVQGRSGGQGVREGDPARALRSPCCLGARMVGGGWHHGGSGVPTCLAVREFALPGFGERKKCLASRRRPLPTSSSATAQPLALMPRPLGRTPGGPATSPQRPSVARTWRGSWISRATGIRGRSLGTSVERTALRGTAGADFFEVMLTYLYKT